MKIRYYSDLHLEFYKHNKLKPKLFNRLIPKLDTDSETVLILAGDIHVDDKAGPFIKHLSSLFKAIIYVPGNHEYYKCMRSQTAIEDVDEKLKNLNIENVHFLNPGSVVIDEQKFIGATLWTNMNNGSQAVMYEAQSRMNDFINIMFRKGESKVLSQLTVYKWLQLNGIHMDYFRDHVTEGSIVISHHAPSHNSIAFEFRHEELLNHAYANNLDQFIIDRKPKLWVHGHVHNTNDYMIGDSRIVCNPFGYRLYQENIAYTPDKVLEI